MGTDHPSLSRDLFQDRIQHMRATRALIHTENLKRNLQSVRQLIKPGTKLCLAVKADGYGHGAVGISETAAAAGVEFLAVAAVSEAEELRGKRHNYPRYCSKPHPA